MKVCSVCNRCFDDAVFKCIEDDADLPRTRHGDPEMVSGYRFDRLIGQYEKAETYLSYHLRSERPCVIKIFAADGDLPEKFLRDAETAASLFDPNIADIYESGSLETGELYVVAEDPAGRSLREILNECGSMELLTAVNIIRQAAEAVHALHLKGIIHRAIRPENIIVSDGDHVRIQNADFGGLLEHAIVSDKFTIDSAVDILRYYSPEQFSGNAVNIKTDIYSLGVVFYEMLAGHPPFEASSAAGLIDMHRNQRPAEVTVDDFDLRMLITHALMESLNKHPESRQSSANAFARQLRHVEQLATHVSTPPPAGNVPPWPVRSVDVVSEAESERKTEIASAPKRPKPIVIPSPIDDVPELIFEFDQHSHLDSSPALEPATTEYVNPAVSSAHVEAVAEHAAFPTASRLTRARRRVKKHHSEHMIDPEAHEKKPAEIQIPEITSDPLPSISIEQRPKKIEWQTPDDDLPSVEDVILAREEIPQQPDEKLFAQPAEEPAVQEIEVEPSLPKPSTISAVTVEAAPQQKEIATPIEPRQSTHPKPVTITNPRKLGLRDDLEEITAVTARSRPIRVPVHRPRAQGSHTMARAALPNASAEDFFFPTLLGGSSAFASDERVSIFGGIFDGQFNVRPVVARSIKVGACLLAFACIVLIGKQLTGELRSEAAPIVVNKPETVSQQVVAQTTYPPVATTRKPQNTEEKPLANSLLAVATKAPQPSNNLPKSKNSSAVSEDRSRTVSETSRAKSSRESTPLKTTKAETTISKNTSNGSKETSKTTALKRNVERPIAQNKPSATTRPRIVANPRP